MFKAIKNSTMGSRVFYYHIQQGVRIHVYTNIASAF